MSGRAIKSQTAIGGGQLCDTLEPTGNSFPDTYARIGQGIGIIERFLVFKGPEMKS